MISEKFSMMITTAVENGITDIYILPKRREYVVKARNSLTVYEIESLSLEEGQKLINYGKYRSDMAVSEQRRPQLGAMDFQNEDHKYALRLSTVGNFDGFESMVIRIIYDLKEVATKFVNRSQLTKLEQLISKRGMIIFAGPTGSGKTTSIYNLAKKWQGSKVIMTIEDPVEIFDADFLQIQVNDEADMSYAELVKVGLRNRPDVFIIGEIRDESTADVAVKAALSGHLVYTTIHAKSPLGVLTRLKNLQVTQEFLEQSVTAIVYQRIINTNSGSQVLMVVNELGELNNQLVYDWQEWQQEIANLVKQNIINKAEGQRLMYG